MGKHSRKAHAKKEESGQAQPWQKIPNHVKKQMNDVVQKLLNKCNKIELAVSKIDWQEFKDIYSLLQEIQQIEKEYVPAYKEREELLSEFYNWCSENGAEFNSVEIKKFSDENFGIISKENIKENDLFLKIPKKIMVSVESAKESLLGALIAKDPILQHMPNVVLALHLLAEFFSENSFWKPYISVLPSRYNTILYFSFEEFQQLQGSPVLGEVFKIYRSVARQYAYFHQIFQLDSYAKTLEVGNFFTYEMYRWAVSTVMTRQNNIPSLDGKLQMSALIPLFDMCNHCNGKYSTDYCLSKNCLESYSLQDYSPGEEVCVFYGTRPNADFFVHNAFIYPENDYDSVVIKLGVSKSDPLYSLKSELCSHKEISLNGDFHIEKNGTPSKELLAFLMVNVMKEDELKKELENKASVEKGFEGSKELKNRALTFLKDRIFLLTKCYKTTIEEDEKLFSSATNPRLQMVIQLRLCEKRILKSAYDYCIQEISS